MPRPPTSRAERLQKLGLQLEEFEESFFRSSGPGGQNVNKVATGVWLVHRPTGTGVKAISHRTQAANRTEAWNRLLTRLERDRAATLRQQRDAAELPRRRSRRKPLGMRRLMVESKRHRAALRAARRLEE